MCLWSIPNFSFHLPDGCLGDVVEPDIDEQARGGEAGAVDGGEGVGEVLFLGGGEEDGVVDFVVRHCCGWSVVGWRGFDFVCLLSV